MPLPFCCSLGYSVGPEPYSSVCAEIRMIYRHFEAGEHTAEEKMGDEESGTDLCY